MEELKVLQARLLEADDQALRMLHVSTLDTQTAFGAPGDGLDNPGELDELGDPSAANCQKHLQMYSDLSLALIVTAWPQCPLLLCLKPTSRRDLHTRARSDLHHLEPLPQVQVSRSAGAS